MIKQAHMLPYLLPGILAVTMIVTEAPEITEDLQGTTAYTNGSSGGDFITQVGDPGTRRRVRRRTRRRVKRRQEAKNSAGFAMQTIYLQTEFPAGTFVWGQS